MKELVTRIDPIEEYGPAMLALTERQRDFVIFVLDYPSASFTKAAAEAGYSTGPQGSSALRVTASRLAHDSKVLAAMREEADKRLQSGAVLGASMLMKIAANDMHKDQFKAASTLLNRIGLHEKTEHKVTVEHKDEPAMLARIGQLAVMLGLDAKALLGVAGIREKPVVPIEVEFTEVGSTEGLEDLLS